MAACVLCGVVLRDGAKFCPKCGSRQDVAPRQPEQASPSLDSSQLARPHSNPYRDAKPLGVAENPAPAAIAPVPAHPWPSPAPPPLLYQETIARAPAQPSPLAHAPVTAAVASEEPEAYTASASPPAPAMTLDCGTRLEVAAPAAALQGVPPEAHIAQAGYATPPPFPVQYPAAAAQGPERPSGIPGTLPLPSPVAQRRGKWLLVVGIAAVVLLIAAFGFLRARTKVAFPAPSTVNTASAEPVPGPASTVQSTAPLAAPTPVLPPPAISQAAEQAPRTEQSDVGLRRDEEKLAAERRRFAREQEQAAEQAARQRQEDEAQRARDLEAQRRAMEELKARQEEQQRQIEEARLKLAEQEAERRRREAVNPLSPTPAAVSRYSGPSSGEIVWEGNIRGTELITIENGQASSGTVTGTLPGVAVLIQPTDPKKVSIASAPGPRNQYTRIVVRVSGNGRSRVTLKWSLP